MSQEPEQPVPWTEAFQQLKAQWAGCGVLSSAEKHTRRLPINSVQTLESVFQPRLLDDSLGDSGKHIGELVRTLDAQGALEPIAVIKLREDKWLCIDGHHRLTAYQQAKGRRTHIPVRVFQGSLEEAYQYSVRANVPNKLNLTHDDKLEAAWRMLLMGVYSFGAINQTTTISKGTVHNMQRTLEQAKARWPASAFETWTWKKVKELFRRGVNQPQREGWEAVKTKELAKQLAKAFNGVPNQHPRLFAGALLLYDRQTAVAVANEIQRQTAAASDTTSDF